MHSYLYDRSIAEEQSSPEHPDIVDNLAATSTHLDFLSHGYHNALSLSASNVPSDIPQHVPTEGDLESYVPSLPTGWATSGVQVKKPTTAAAASASAKPSKSEVTDVKKKKSRHALPKGAVAGKPFNEDVSVIRVCLFRRNLSTLVLESPVYSS